MRVLILGDLHFPFHNKEACKVVWKRICEVKYTHIIQIGDLLDQYSFTRFAKKNIFLPDRELKFGRELAVEMWDKIVKQQPGAVCVQLLGNHDVRAVKRAQEKLPEAQDIVRDSLLELYQFEGVYTVQDPRQEYFIDDICFLHGYRSKLGDHTKFMHKSTVHGHTHRGGMLPVPINGKTLWELDVGYLADCTKEPMAYSEQKTNNWTLGFGEIDSLGARFNPINL